MLNHAQLARADINLLLVFDLLFEERNSARAAARLNLSPSAISHALKRLRSLLNDPLFLPTSRGMVPTERAQTLAPAVRDIVERVGGVIGSAEGFDPATTVRRFRIGAPDGAVSVLVPGLVERLEAQAPMISLALLQVLPRAGSTGPEESWRDALTDLGAGRYDMAVLPHAPQQWHFHSVPLYSEDFVIAARRGHPIGLKPSVESVVAAGHVLVSATGDSSGFVDRMLAERGYGRRIALTVPNFFMAASAIASSDLIGALPRHFAMEAARTFPLQIAEPPFVMGSADLNAIVPQAAMLDEGIQWLLKTVGGILAQEM